MFELDKKVAQKICTFDLSIDPAKWFAEELNDLASKFPGLDDMPQKAMFPLAQLSAKGAMDLAALKREACLEEGELIDYLDALIRYGLAKISSAGEYEATDRGSRAFRAFGRKLITRVRMEADSQYKHFDSLHKAINSAW